MSEALRLCAISKADRMSGGAGKIAESLTTALQDVSEIETHHWIGFVHEAWPRYGYKLHGGCVLSMLRRSANAVSRAVGFIGRLYNRGIRDEIRSFDDEESYEAGLFSHRMENAPDVDAAQRAVYRKIRQMLTEGAARSIGCLWQTTGMMLAAAGNLLYGAPRSPKLGSVLKTSAQKIFSAKLRKRGEIIADPRATCIHDYPSPERLSSSLQRERVGRWRQRLSLQQVLERCRVDTGEIVMPHRDLSGDPGSILVAGWHGTETAGDRAILGGVLTRVKQQYPRAVIAITSLHPFITERTLAELGHAGIEVVSVFDPGFECAVKRAQWVVIAGGPLMHIEELGLLRHAFWVGGDDREFADVLACRYLNDLQPIMEQRPLSVSDLLSAMHEGSMNLCMRYHSVVFAHVLGLEFLPIDYTGGGKIYSYAPDNGFADKVVDLGSLSQETGQNSEPTQPSVATPALEQGAGR